MSVKSTSDFGLNANKSQSQLSAASASLLNNNSHHSGSVAASAGLEQDGDEDEWEEGLFADIDWSTANLGQLQRQLAVELSAIEEVDSSRHSHIYLFIGKCAVVD